jgi:hypothetical protein
MSRAPVTYTWDGEAMVPLASLAKRCDEMFVVGERYRLEEASDRSTATHNHEFAWLAEAWKTLPERYKLEPWAQSAEHLRKYALIATGHCLTDTFTCGSNAEALRWAPRLRSDDEYCIVQVQGSVVHRYRAKSQARKAMNRKEFQASKQAILEFVAGLLEVTPETLANVREAA